MLESGRIELPLNVDIPTLILSDGKLNGKHQVEGDVITKLFDDFFLSLPDGALEERTVVQIYSHRVHLEKFLGKKFVLAKSSSWQKVRLGKKFVLAKSLSWQSYRLAIYNLMFRHDQKGKGFVDETPTRIPSKRNS